MSISVSLDCSKYAVLFSWKWKHGGDCHEKTCDSERPVGAIVLVPGRRLDGIAVCGDFFVQVLSAKAGRNVISGTFKSRGLKLCPWNVLSSIRDHRDSDSNVIAESDLQSQKQALTDTRITILTNPPSHLTLSILRSCQSRPWFKSDGLKWSAPSKTLRTNNANDPRTLITMCSIQFTPTSKHQKDQPIPEPHRLGRCMACISSGGTRLFQFGLP